MIPIKLLKEEKMNAIIEALFMDRDGTIGGDSSVTYPGEFKLYPFTTEALELVKKHKIDLFVFTNQPGISKGECSLQLFEKELIGFGF